MNLDPPRDDERSGLGSGWRVTLSLTSPEYELRNLAEYWASMERAIAVGRRNFEARIEKEAAERSMSPEEADDFYDFHSDEYGRWDAVFPSVLRANMVLSSVGLLESSLSRLCDDLTSELAGRTELPWLRPRACFKRDTGLIRCRKFMLENLRIDFARSARWQSMLGVQKIRNALAHAGGDINALSPKHGQLARAAVAQLRRRGVSETQLGRIEFSAGFPEWLIGEFREFALELERTCMANRLIGPIFWP